MTTMPRFGTGLTVDDLDDFPDDGWRYELVDGTLLVSAAPSFAHQRAQARLTALLLGAAPPGLDVLASPFRVVLAVDTAFEPDLLVAPTSQFTTADLPGAPLLAVEILSPSSRLIDPNVKKPRFEEARCPSFWLVDPLRPRLTAWELVDGAYVEVADVYDDESWTASSPFPVTVTPSALVDDR